MAIATLVNHGLVAFVVSQNVDGLHVRSGIPPTALAELHGNCFVVRWSYLHPFATHVQERCVRCGTRFVRDFEMDSVGFKPTGRRCVHCHTAPDLAACTAKQALDTMPPGQNNGEGVLVDHVLDWDDALPDEDLDAAEAHCLKADLVLCLGTSLQIPPAGELPETVHETNKDRQRMLIVRRCKVPCHDRAGQVCHRE